MLAMTCAKCGRRYTPTDAELQVYLDESQGKKYALVLCPHCGKGNKVAVHRLQQVLQSTPGAGASRA